MKEEVTVEINNHPVKLTNLSKVFWPEEGFTKADVLNYYTAVSPYILPHLNDRPLVMKRYPDGITGDFFYQKRCPDYAPDWLEQKIIDGDKEDPINYIICNNLQTLLWVVNQGSIEIHAWLSRRDMPDYPDMIVFDLDPAPPARFQDVLDIALEIRGILSHLKLTGIPKTSGVSGLHIFLPIARKYTFSQVREFVGSVAIFLAEKYPDKATVERKVSLRTGRVYIDYLQNGRGRTMTWVYSLRPEPGAPVSTPLTWKEVETGGFEPRDFNIRNIPARVKKLGDLYYPMLQIKQDLSMFFKSKLY